MPHKESTPKEIEPNKILINRGDLGGILLIKYIKSILKVGLYFQHPFGIAIRIYFTFRPHDLSGSIQISGVSPYEHAIVAVRD